ncbi:MAG: Lrp/AsnC family transcriptional regulator [Kiritimatiellaeota bacterium]|nr:Lrp/AsnC family transcriptional regulator [Kiritimatiellota bacterium]
MLDKVDFAILGFLQAQARMSNSELARRVGLSESACLARTRRLQTDGTIKQFVTVVDARKVGMEITTFTFVTLAGHNRKTANTFVDRIKQTPEVLECYNVTGQWDYLLKIVAKDISAYRDFVIDRLIEIDGVDKVETLIVLKSEKESFSLPLDMPQAKRK